MKVSVSRPFKTAPRQAAVQLIETINQVATRWEDDLRASWLLNLNAVVTED
jgi:hypothetical protein